MKERKTLNAEEINKGLLVVAERFLAKLVSITKPKLISQEAVLLLKQKIFHGLL